MIRITFPDGSVKTYRNGITSLEIAEEISPKLAGEVYAASVNDVVVDLSRPVTSDATLKLHKWEDEPARHALAFISSSHG